MTMMAMMTTTMINGPLNTTVSPGGIVVAIQ